jgi:hypothetical protein
MRTKATHNSDLHSSPERPSGHSSGVTVRRELLVNAGVWLQDHYPLVICEVLLLLSMLLLDRPLIRGDAVAYFMWTASIGRDLDMDLENQAHHFAELNTYMAMPSAQTGRYGNAFAWGTGLVLQPAFQAARLFDQLPSMRVNDDWFYALQRYPYAYSLLAMLQVNIMTMLSLALAYSMARRLGISSWPAAWAGLTTAWGTPLLYYSSIQPIYAHATAAFVHTLALWFFLHNLTEQREPAWWRWLLSGLAFGLAALVRWQLALSIVPCGVALLYTKLRQRPLTAWRSPILLGVGFAVLAWHIPYTFNWMFGSPLSMPMGSGFVTGPRYLWDILFSNYRGFFLWSPIALVGVLGLLTFRRSNIVSALVLLCVVITQIVINAGVETWSGGESFGLRRLTELYPALAVGVAMALSAGAPLVRRTLYALTGALALYGIVLLFAALIFHYFTLPEMGYVSVQPVDTLTNVLRFFFSPPKFDLIWPMMEHHFGWWAWSRPGP